jgi:hypothetical protein
VVGVVCVEVDVVFDVAVAVVEVMVWDVCVVRVPVDVVTLVDDTVDTEV